MKGLNCCRATVCSVMLARLTVTVLLCSVKAVPHWTQLSVTVSESTIEVSWLVPETAAVPSYIALGSWMLVTDYRACDWWLCDFLQLHTHCLTSAAFAQRALMTLVMGPCRYFKSVSVSVIRNMIIFIHQYMVCYYKQNIENTCTKQS